MPKNYYVNNVTGDDSDSGETPALAFASITHALENGVMSGAGDDTYDVWVKRTGTDYDWLYLRLGNNGRDWVIRLHAYEDMPGDLTGEQGAIVIVPDDGSGESYFFQCYDSIRLEFHGFDIDAGEDANPFYCMAAASGLAFYDCVLRVNNDQTRTIYFYYATGANSRELFMQDVLVHGPANYNDYLIYLYDAGGGVTLRRVVYDDVISSSYGGLDWGFLRVNHSGSAVNDYGSIEVEDCELPHCAGNFVEIESGTDIADLTLRGNIYRGNGGLLRWLSGETNDLPDLELLWNVAECSLAGPVVDVYADSSLGATAHTANIRGNRLVGVASSSGDDGLRTLAGYDQVDLYWNDVEVVGSSGIGLNLECANVRARHNQFTGETGARISANTWEHSPNDVFEYCTFKTNESGGTALLVTDGADPYNYPLWPVFLRCMLLAVDPAGMWIMNYGCTNATPGAEFWQGLFDYCVYGGNAIQIQGTSCSSIASVNLAWEGEDADSRKNNNQDAAWIDFDPGGGNYGFDDGMWSGYFGPADFVTPVGPGDIT